MSEVAIGKETEKERSLSASTRLRSVGSSLMVAVVSVTRAERTKQYSQSSYCSNTSVSYRRGKEEEVAHQVKNKFCVERAQVTNQQAKVLAKQVREPSDAADRPPPTNQFTLCLSFGSTVVVFELFYGHVLRQAKFGWR